MAKGTSCGQQETFWKPSDYRALQAKGQGGVAMRFGLTKDPEQASKPGPYNILQYFVDPILGNGTIFNGRVRMAYMWILNPFMAKDLHDAGFATKQAVYDWWWKATFDNMYNFHIDGSYNHETNGGLAIESTSGKPFKDLPDDYLIPITPSPSSNTMIVAGGISERCFLIHCDSGRPVAQPIDPWR